MNLKFGLERLSLVVIFPDIGLFKASTWIQVDEVSRQNSVTNSALTTLCPIKKWKPKQMTIIQ